MMPAAVIADRLSKRYCLGELNRGLLLKDALARGLGRGGRGGEAAEDVIWALRDVSFAVEQGSVLGIIGHNGAGKSTLLKILSRITYPTLGSMTVRGRVASLLEVGTGFHDELTGRENIYLNGSILGMKRREIAKHLDSIVDFAGVEQFLDTPVKRYSSGMRLRLGFAVAAHLEPDVLLVDEVLAVGDAGFQKKCLGAMSNLHAGGRTVLFVSHNLTAVENLCPRTIWMDKGRVCEEGPSHEVIQRYLAAFADTSGVETDLSRVRDRQGSGQVRFTSIEFLDDEGRPVGVVRSGGAVTLRLHFDVARRVQHPQFGIEIHTNAGSLVTSINTCTAGLGIESLEPGPGHIDVRIDCMNLTPDRYCAVLWMAGAGAQVHDRVDPAFAIDIEAADVHNSGRSIANWYGVAFMYSRWRHWESGAEAGSWTDLDEPASTCILK